MNGINLSEVTAVAETEYPGGSDAETGAVTVTRTVAAIKSAVYYELQQLLVLDVVK